MYTIEATRDGVVDPAAVFALYMDPSTWSTWGHNARWARADGPLVEGGTVDVRARYGATYHCRIKRLVPDRALEIEVRPVGLAIVNVYEIEPTADGARVHHAFEMSGPFAGPIRWLGIARLYRRLLDAEIRDVIALAQSRSRTDERVANS